MFCIKILMAFVIIADCAVATQCFANQRFPKVI